ncbi:uncharacterized protein V1513DRAFT_445122 [Lipomyces chichibuensis]|uniref:uncharacterized protein n=1 Tax=Lipomyces chichibuensis TaxID=1546026 RepID=UPI0033436F1E
MAHKHSSSSVSMASDRDVDEGDFLVPAESIESTNEVQTATAASLIGTRPTQVLVNPRRVSGTPSISSTVSSSTVTPATVGARGKGIMAPPPTAPRTVYAAPVPEYNSDLGIGPPSPTASTTSFFTSTSGVEQSANETDNYVDAVDDGYSSRASTETIPAAVVSSAAVPSAAAAPEAALVGFESTGPEMTSSDVSTNRTAVPESNGSTLSEKAGLAGSAVEVGSAPIAAATIGKGTMKTLSSVTNSAANTGKLPVAISEKEVTSEKKSNKRKWVIIIALIVAIAIGVAVGVGVGVGTRKHQNNSNSTAAGGASSSAVSSTAPTSSSTGARSSAISTSISVVSERASVTSAAISRATSDTSSMSPSSSASNTRALSSFSTVTTTQSSPSRSSPSTTSSVSSDDSVTTAPSSANPSLTVFRTIYTTMYPTSVVDTRTYLGFPFKTTVVMTTTAVRTAIHTLTVS